MEEKEKSGISRREFLKDAGLVVGGAAVGAGIAYPLVPEKEVIKEVEVVKEVEVIKEVEVVKEVEVIKEVEVPVEVIKEVEVPKIKLTVNGYEYKLHVEPEDDLRDTLRDKLGLTSIKDMCTGYGACGSCTVIMDGRPVLSCMTLAIECDGATIETAEGLADANHPLIEAYIRNHCMQCGYCTPGFILTAKALLDHNPNPTEAEIRDALGGNICRCGTYPAHILAVKEAAKEL